MSTRERIAGIRVPVFSVGGWYDNYGQSDLEAFAALKKLGRTARVAIGPWPHNMSTPFESVDFGPDSTLPVAKLQLAWFDYYLKGKGPDPAKAPPLKIFVMGRNRWRDEE